MERRVEYRGDIRHIGDYIRFAGNEGLNLRDNLLILFFFCHEDSKLLGEIIEQNASVSTPLARVVRSLLSPPRWHAA